MQRFSLVAALIAIVNILPCVVGVSEENVANGLPPSEHDNITIALTEVKTPLQEAKAESEKAKESQSEIMAFLQEVKNSLSEINIELQDVKKSQSELKIELLDGKKKAHEIEMRNSDQLVNVSNSLQEVKIEQNKERKNWEVLKDLLVNVTESQSVIQTFIQEVKVEQTNERKNWEVLKEQLVNVTESQSVIQTFIQEAKSEVVNHTKQNSDSLTAIMTTLDNMIQKKNCAEFLALGVKVSGVRTVYPEGPLNPRPVSVFCDQLLDGGGWTVIQNRDDLPVRISFERSWQEYVKGFGDLEGEFWLGLDNMHAITSSTPMQLRVDMEDWEGVKRWAKYSEFSVGDPASKYRLSIDGYTGDAGEGWDGSSGMTYNNGAKFSTYDPDSDSKASSNCPKERRSGWWFHGCTYVNPNGFPHNGNYTAPAEEGIDWPPFRKHYYSLKKISLKIRPV